MFLWCERCEVEFLPRRNHYLSKCPRCGAEQQNDFARAEPRSQPLRLAVRNRAPWVPRWLGPVSGLGTGLIYVSDFGHAWVNYAAIGLVVTGFGGAAIWDHAKRTVVLEFGRGRIAAPARLRPWPGRWIPASAVQRIRVDLAPKGEALRAVAAVLRGGLEVPLLDDVHQKDAPAVAAAIEAALGAPAPEVLPEVHVSAGERQARVEWNCGRAASVSVDADALCVRSAGRTTLELDTDFVDAVQVVAEPHHRFQLVAATRKGATQVLLAGEPAREPLEVVAREIRRVLRLELPAVKVQA